jgi:hypothetical protein
MTTENRTPAAIRQALREYEDCEAAARNKLRSTIQVPLYRADPETSQAIDEAFQDCVRKIERGRTAARMRLAEAARKAALEGLT